MTYQKYIAECIGTFTLALLVSLSLSATLLPTPLVAALTVGCFIYTIGNISGAHLNPAVTIAIFSLRKISMKDALLYLVSQFVGAGLALLLVQSLTSKATHLVAADTFTVAFAEGLGAFFLLFGIASVVYGKVHSAASGLVIGTSLLIGILIAGSFSNGILNPAVALALGSFSFAYILGPIVGAIIGAWAYGAIVQSEKTPATRRAR